MTYRNRALIYGKQLDELRGRKKRSYLSILHKSFDDIHATIHVKVQNSFNKKNDFD